jgi:hypothetical protein
MASRRVYTTLQKMPAAAGHIWVEARPFGLSTSNDPRGH